MGGGFRGLLLGGLTTLPQEEIGIAGFGEIEIGLLRAVEEVGAKEAVGKMNGKKGGF